MTSSANFCKSMLPPDTIATIGPEPAFPVNAAARGRAPAERQRRRRRGFGLRTPDADRRIERLHGAADPRDQSAASDGGDDGGGIGRVLQDFQAHRRMTGDEVLVVERMDERPKNPRIRPVVERLPGDLVRHQHEGRPERSHALELRCRRRLDRYHGARHTGLPGGVGDTLAGVSRADRPDTAATLGVRQQGDGVGGAAQLVRVDRLQSLELEPDLGSAGTQLETHQRCARDRLRDAGARIANLRELDGPDRIRSRWHGARTPERRTPGLRRRLRPT